MPPRVHACARIKRNVNAHLLAEGVHMSPEGAHTHPEGVCSRAGRPTEGRSTVRYDKKKDAT